MASKSTSRAARSKRTKDELISEMEALETKYKNVAPTADPIAAKLADERATAARTVAKSMTVDALVREGGEYALSLGRAMAAINERAVARAEELKALDEAIAAETAELERLYELDIASASVRALVEEHSAKRAALEAAYEEGARALEKDIAEKRQQWKEEEAAHFKQVGQRNRDLENQRAREQAEYDYKTSQARARAEEEFNYKLQIAQRNETERVTKAQNALFAREQAVVEGEKTLEAGHARIANIDAEIATAVKAAEGKATGMAEARCRNEFALKEKDYQQQLAIAQQKNSNAAELNQRLAAEVEDLKKQLTNAKEQVTQVTIKALEASSGQQALQNLQSAIKDNALPTRSKA
jgi:colicin import membrane protein